MTTLTLYKLQHVDLTVQFPATWNECTLPELQFIADSIFLERYTQPQLLIELIKYRIHKTYPGMKQRQIEEVIILLSIEDLAMNYQALMAFITDKVELTTQPMKVIGTLEGPADNFNDITVGEFEDAEHYFIKWFQSKEQVEIADLIGVLWRPVADGQRVPYLEYHISFESARTIELLRPNMRYVALLWYMGCKALLPRMYPLVYGGTDAPVDANTPPEVDRMAITKLIHHGAGPKNGTREQIRKMKLHEFLFDLNLEAEKQALGE